MRYYNLYVENTNQLFIYADKNNEFSVGDFVIVPFRRSKKTAIIIEEIDIEKFKKENLKKDDKNFKVFNISSLIKDSIKLEDYQIKLIKWLVSYYMCNIQAAISCVIPSNIKNKVDFFYDVDFKKLISLRDENLEKFLIDIMSIKINYAKTKFKAKLFKELISKKLLIVEEEKNIIYPNLFLIYDLEKNYFEIFSYFKNKIKIKKNSPILKNKFLLDEDILSVNYNINEVKEKEIKYEDFNLNSNILTLDQNQAFEQIKNSQEKYFLLKGVTGSGKTEIYMELIKDAIKENMGSIFLVPEISLTPQMINRFKEEFKNNIAVLHSRLSDKERKAEWLALHKGEKKIVLGVRSAIFAPIKNLKYIILDEEHESTYKQDGNSPKYNAKYVAIKRSMLQNSKIIFGSATPSIETYYYAKNNIYKLINLKNRYGNAILPDVKLVDMKQEDDIYFSKDLINEIKNTLLRKEQVLLLLNRKGFSTYLQCKSCGHVEECSNCSIKMTYYRKANILKCNYCGKTIKYNGACSKCGSNDVFQSGKGIERIEDELKKYFDVNIAVADADTNKKNSFESIYKDFKENKYQILIGTQIISKGLNFPNVTLVGVINADLILNFPDFRASEKTFQLLTQVSGRAGRGEKKGKVIIQSYQTENFCIKNSKEENYLKFYENEIEFRKILEYPPFSKIINIGISSTEENILVNITKELDKDIRNNIKNINLSILGPHPSFVYKVKNRYRYNILIKGDRKNIEKFKKILAILLNKYKNNEKYRIVVDIDPINMI